MNIIDIINKKRLGKILSEEEIKYVIEGYVDGTIPDYQMSSLLMAIVLKKMTENEIILLTKYMLESGSKLNLDFLEPIVDKHSTGGVGDKTTLIVAPLVAACGVKVAKMSGRGLGHTGGTIDKLESIPGFQTNLSTDEFLKQVSEIGVSVVSQTNNLVPADKKIYALRDVTGTVESNALIASSIMSKKIASGTKKIVIDVKVGTGALIKTLKDAKELSNMMIKIGKHYGIEVVCLLTNMDYPLGSNIGNAKEVEEAISILKNKTRNNLSNLCIELASQMVGLGLNLTYTEAKEIVINNLENGTAYLKFQEFIERQHGSLLELPTSKYQYDIISPKSGFINKIDALELGKLSMHLGSGRESLDDKIDYGAGIILKKQVGDNIKKDEIIMSLYTNKQQEEIDQLTKNIFCDTIEITQKKEKLPNLIYEVIK